MNEQEKLQAIQKRDKSYDGKFLFGVKTTKIICRPGCPANTIGKEYRVFGYNERSDRERLSPLQKM